MSKTDAYRKKIEAELELAQAKLQTWKAKAKNVSADISIEFNKDSEELEKHFATLKDNLKELGEAGEHSLETIKKTGDSALKAVGHALEKISKKFHE
jgi:ElaB/YqjD/DUF883 family membrane-anchored ribosome-binding protein